MKKIIEINGMHCVKCAAKVENALNAIEGVCAKVNLQKKQAVAAIKGEVADGAVAEAVTALGFEVVAITEKKGIFG